MDLRDVRLRNVSTGKCFRVISLSEREAVGMNLRAAQIDEKTARLLYCNGAAVPEEH